MSMIKCFACGDIVDSDAYPMGFYRQSDGDYEDEPGDEYYCPECNEKDW